MEDREGIWRLLLSVSRLVDVGSSKPYFQCKFLAVGGNGYNNRFAKAIGKLRKILTRNLSRFFMAHGMLVLELR